MKEYPTRKITKNKLMNKNTLMLFCLTLTVLLPHFNVNGQNQSTTFNPEKNRKLRVMFYNVENTFDTIDNPETRDDEFLPDGERHWNTYKYYKKIKSIYKVFVAAGGWELPELIGLCEIENETILKDLTSNTPLSKYEYSYVHQNSPDHRGIDVCLLYNPQEFKPDQKQFIPLNLPDKYRTTREILYVKGHTSHSDTLHIFINHWPSKWGGEKETNPKRVLAAKTLRRVVDSIFHNNTQANIIITGDFNDEPEKASISNHLKAEKPGNAITSSSLYNLSYNWARNDMGTHKYQGRWSVLDQFIVSGALLQDTNSLATDEAAAHIFKHPVLLEEDKKHLGKKPYRTFSGYRYNGGYSDHLPIVLDLE
jgi:predicted extracellular nuclease